jgi:predicted membrane protein
MRNRPAMTIGLLLFGCCLAFSLSVQAQNIEKREAEIKTTQSLEFGASGTIQIVDSFGSVKVEGWDKEEVELTVTKRTQKKYAPKDIAKATKELERFKVTMETIGETSLLAINTTYPSWTPARMFRGKTNLNLDYLVKIPRQSSLLIKHGIGEVNVTNVSGDIEATASIGEVSLNLPEDQSYSVDARVRIGDVSSEFGQTTQRKGFIPLGAKLAGDPTAPTRRIFLRLGIGDINVNKLQSEKSSEPSAQSGPEEKAAEPIAPRKDLDEQASIPVAQTGKAPAPLEAGRAPALPEAGALPEFRWQGRLAAKQTIEIQNLKGNVVAEQIDGDQVEVIAVKNGRDDLSHVTIQVNEHAGGATLCAIYPNQDPNNPYRCLPNNIVKGVKVGANIDGGVASVQFEGAGGGDVRLVDVAVDFIVRVPKNAGFIGSTVVGRVETKSLAGDVAANSVLGDVMIELPSDGSAKVQAKSDLGGVEADWPLERKSSGNFGESAQGLIGDGQYNLRLTTATGNIRIRRAPRH